MTLALTVNIKSLASVEQQLTFERKGHLLLRSMFPKTEIDSLSATLRNAAEERQLESYRHRLSVLCPDIDPFSITSTDEAKHILRNSATEEVGFLQHLNLHRTIPSVAKLINSPSLVAAASALLGSRKIRLYQDCLFVKLPGFGSTNWHSDLNMVPLDTNHFLTFWVPLRTLEEEDSTLLFASGSHRDFALPYWQSLQGMQSLESRGYPLECYSGLQAGDITCHHGWTLHCAPAQPTDRDSREAFTVSFFVDGARVLNTKHARRKPCAEDSWSHREWSRDLKEGQLARHKLLPLVGRQKAA